MKAFVMRAMAAGFAFAALIALPAVAQTSANGLMYVGTLDKKLLIVDEDKEEVVGEIPMAGVPRNTELSADKKLLYVMSTKMGLEVVDLAARKSSLLLNLADGRSRPDIFALTPDLVNPGNSDFDTFSGLAVDPTGHYIYTSIRVTVKDLDEYRIEPMKFVAIDLHNGTIAKSFPFPKEMSQGFAGMVSFKVSPDGKLLYVFGKDILIFDLATFTLVDKIALSKPSYPGASPLRLTVTDGPYDDPTKVTSVFTSVDPIVHKGTLGLATLNLATREVNYAPIGPSYPMLGFMVSPDHKLGYSVMFNYAGGNRRTEWWVWDLQTHQVIKTQPFESRTTFKFGISSDGKKLYLYGSGSTLEIFDAATLTSRKVMYLNRDITTNLVTLARK
jgi:DNA-binding beta-propeller fold protein YncE